MDIDGNEIELFNVNHNEEVVPMLYVDVNLGGG